MALVSTLVRKPVSVFIIFVIVMGFGIFISFRLNVELLPNIEVPFVYVSTSYPNASSQEVEDVITKPIESAIIGVQNIKEISSTSSEEHSGISIEFKYGTSLDKNVSNIRSKLNEIATVLPKEAETPRLFQYNPGDIPVVELAVSGNRSSKEVRQIIEDVLKPVFEDVDGVASVQINGGQREKVFVNVDLYKLKEFGISISDVKNAIATRGVKTSLGSIEGDVQNIGLFMSTKYKSIEDLRSTVVAKITESDKSVSHIFLRDIAEVYKGYDNEVSRYRFLGDKQVVLVEFRKKSGENIVKVSGNIINALDTFKRNSPPDFDFTVIEDNSEYVRQNLRNIAQAVILGAILATIVLMVFLRSFASVLVIAIAIPSSVVITLIIMYLFGTSLNIMTLAGLALGIGMLVDNAIVVLENIYIKRMNGVRLLSASEFGAIEMSRPIFASTLTTIMVFLPVILLKSELGYIVAFFLDLALIVVTSIISSYVIAAFFVPVLTSCYIPIHPLHHKGLMKKFDNLFDRVIGSISRRYVRAMKYMVIRRKRFIVLIFVGSLAIPVFLSRGMGFEMFPKFQQNGLDVHFSFESGTKATEVLKTLRDAHAKIAPRIPDVKFFLMGANNGSGKISYTFTKVRDVQEIDAIGTKIKPLLRGYMGVRTTIRADGNRGGGSGGGGRNIGKKATVSLEVKAEDYQVLLDTVEVFTRVLENSAMFENASADKDISDAPQYTLSINTGKAALYGVSISSISKEISNSIRESVAGKFTDGTKERNIVVRLNLEDRKRLDILNQIDVKNAQGTFVPIINFVTITPSKALSTIYRENGKRTLTITATMAGKHSVAKAVEEAKALLRTVPRNENVTYAFSGDYKEQQKNIRLMLIIIIIAMVFVFGVMASQFESLLDPFIILFTIPLTLSGVFLLYRILGLTISAFSLVGIVVLVGVAVNHGIVMVDYMNLLRKRDVPLLDAVLEGASSRLLPILMTSCTTILGLFPTAFFNFEGSELIRPIAVTVVGGLSTSVFLSLLLIPLLYYSFTAMSEKRLQKKRMKQKRTHTQVAVPKDYMGLHNA